MSHQQILRVTPIKSCWMQLVSSDFEHQARSKYAAATGRKYTGSWKWVQAPFSSVVRFLAPAQAIAGELGKGSWSLGFVQ